MNKTFISFFLLIFFLFFSDTRLYAQEEPANTEKLKHSIGAVPGLQQAMAYHTGTDQEILVYR